jgi:hypothetical protein
MKLLLIIIFTGMMTRGGCIVQPLVNELPAKPVGSYHIKKIDAVSGTVYIDLLCGVPDPCHVYAKTERTISGDNVDITVYARPRSKDPCIAIVGSIETKVRVSVPHPGDYMFTFHGAWVSKDTIITVPPWYSLFDSFTGN